MIFNICLNVPGNEVITITADEYTTDHDSFKFFKDGAIIAIFDRHSVVYIIKETDNSTNE